MKSKLLVLEYELVHRLAEHGLNKKNRLPKNIDNLLRSFGLRPMPVYVFRQIR